MSSPADGALPAHGVYGLPEQWPHVHAILDRAGFVPGSRWATSKWITV